MKYRRISLWSKGGKHLKIHKKAQAIKIRFTNAINYNLKIT